MANSKSESLSVYGKLLQQLLHMNENADISEEVLFTLPVLKIVTYKKKNIITRFTKQICSMIDSH